MTITVPVATLQPLKEALISLGYANEQTPLEFIQDCYFKYILVRQTGFNPNIPYALEFTPQAIRDQLAPPASGGVSNKTDAYFLGYMNTAKVVTATSPPGFDIYVDGVKYADHADIELPYLNQPLAGKVQFSMMNDWLNNEFPEDVEPTQANERRTMAFHVVNLTNNPVDVRVDVIVAGAPDAVRPVGYGDNNTIVANTVTNPPSISFTLKGLDD